MNANKLQNYQIYVKDIVQPLFRNTCLNFFSYDRVYADNSNMYLASKPTIFEECIKKKAISCYDEIQNFYTQRQDTNVLHNTFFFLLNEENATADNVMKHNGFSDAFVILTPYKNEYFEALTFSSNKTDELVRFCFSHWDILIQFKQYFLSQYKSLIEAADRCKIKIPRNKHEYILTNNNSSISSKKLLEKIKPNYYTINYNNIPVKLTIKEFACLKHCWHGRKDKETARLANLSPKTVEHYLDDLKAKFQVQSRSQLIDIYFASDLVAL